MRSSEYDVVVLGAGAAGENVADGAVRGGLSAVLIEEALVGGACSYWACIPSKALLRPGHALRAARAVGGAAQAVGNELDVAAVLARRDYWVNTWSDASQVAWANDSGITVMRGRGRITGVREVTVRGAGGEEELVRAHHAVVVATGSEPAMPSIPGLDSAHAWTSKEATSTTTIPVSMIIIGGGVVAAELATAYASLGSTVHVVARSGLLSTMEPFCGALLARALEERGVGLRLNTDVTHVARRGAQVEVSTSEGEVLTSEQILVATGRRPRTQDIGLDAVGLQPSAWVATDDSMRCPEIDWLYAVGDVTGRALLTHQGKYQARAAAQGIVARANGTLPREQPWDAFSATADRVAVPQVIFTDPEIASVGLTSREAEHSGRAVDVVDYDLGAVSGAGLHADHYTGQARMVLDRESRVVIGATFAGPDVGELVHAATVAIVGEVPIERLWHAVPAYPTISEIWLRLLETYRRQVTRV